MTLKEDHEALMNTADNSPRGVVPDRDGRPDARGSGEFHHQRSIPELMQELESREHPDLERDSGDLFLEELDKIAAEDVAGLKLAQKSYGNSWKSRGGIGAFMMLARKWDRLENRVKRLGDILNLSRLGRPNLQAQPYDIFQHIACDQRAEGIIDDVRDLRRYLMLVEAEMRARGFDATHRDNK